MNPRATDDLPFDATSACRSPRHASLRKRKEKLEPKLKPDINAITHPVRSSRPITYDEIMEGRTPAAKLAGVGSWSKQQLAEWGVPSPPGKGWIERLIRESHEPRVCGPHCFTETVLNAALTVIMKRCGISEDEALDAFVVEFQAGR